MSSQQHLDEERKLRQQEALQRKEKIHNVYTDVQDGKLPNTAEITQAIDNVKQSGVMQETASSMSPAGKKVIADTEKIMDTTKRVFEEKNDNDELQSAFYHGTKAMKGASGTIKEHGVPRRNLKAGTANAQELSQEAARRAWNVARLIVTSSEFRKLVFDLQQVLQDSIRTGVAASGQQQQYSGQHGDQYSQQQPLSGQYSPQQPLSGQYSQQQPQSGQYSPQQPLSGQYSQQQPQSDQQQPLSGEYSQQQPFGGEYGQQQSQSDQQQPLSGEYSQQQPLGGEYGQQQPISGEYSEQPLGGQYIGQYGEQHPGQSGDQRQQPIHAGGYEGEATPREAASAIKATSKQHVGDLYQQATSGAEPIIQRYSAGELTTKEATSQLGRGAVQGVRAAVDNIELSDEQRDVLIGRFKKILIEVHGSDEFQSALDDLVEIIRAIANHGEQVGQHVTQATQKVSERHGDHLTEAQNSARTLVEKFAGGKSLDGVIQAITDMGREVRNDEELRRVLDDMAEFLRRSLRDTDYIQRVDWNNEASDLFKRGRHNLVENHRGNVDRVFDEASAFATALQRDEITNELASDLERLTSDLFLDENGKPAFKYELVKDFVKIVPIIASKLEYLALPKIDYADDEFEYILDNIVLRCTNIIPRHLRIRTDTKMRIEPPTTRDHVQGDTSMSDAGVSMDNRIEVTIAEIRAHAMDMAFYYNKKTGLAKMMDVGYADMSIPDKGVSIHLTLAQANDKDRANVIKVEKADCTIHEFKLKLHDTKHDFLYKLLSPMINKSVKKQAEKAIEKQLYQIVFQLDQQLTKLSERAEQTRQETMHQAAGTLKQAGGNLKQAGGNFKETGGNLKHQAATSNTPAAKLVQKEE